MGSVEAKKRRIASIMEKVNNSEISSIKQTVTRIINTINDPNSSAKDLKNIIEIDPPLTAKLLKLANSAFYGYPKTISEIQEAIVCIGFDAVRELALNQKVCEIFAKEGYIEGYTRTALWKHSLAVALCCKLIYRREFMQRGENIYVAGLLHDIGIIVLDQFMHEAFKNNLQRSRSDRNNLFNIEKNTLGFDHTDLAGALAENWGFPDEMREAMEKHHSPDSTNGENRSALTLFIADYSVQTKMIGYSDAPYKNNTLYQKCLLKLQLKEKAVELIIKEVDAEIKKMDKADWF